MKSCAILLENETKPVWEGLILNVGILKSHVNKWNIKTPQAFLQWKFDVALKYYGNCG